ncbi:MAG: hypothetical protein ACM3XM_02090 [Mycobacterium leprae]
MSRRKLWAALGLALVTTAFLAGCGGKPKATAPQTEFDFGDLPVTADMQHHSFTVQNTGNGDLKLTGISVVTLQGC